MHNDRTNHLKYLRETINFYEGELASAQEALKKAQERVARAEQDLRRARDFLEMERRRLGMEAIAEPTRITELGFVGMSIKAACLVLLRKHGELTAEELQQKLEAGGLKLGKYPKRAINMALIRVKEIKRPRAGVYKLQEDKVRLI